MQDIIEKLAQDVKQDIIKVCERVADLHRIHSPDNEWLKGYNAAVADIAAKIRRLA